MRIGIDISQIVYQGTGVSTYTRSLVKALVSDNTRDEFVLFGSSLRNRLPLIDFAVQLEHKVKTKFSFLPPKAMEILWNYLHIIPIETFSGRVDVFHTSDWLEPPARCPKVTTIHDLAVFKYPETFSARGGHDIVANHKRKLRLVNQDKDIIIAVSQNTKQDIIDLLKIPEKRIKVVYEASEPIFTPSMDSDITRVKNKYGINENYFICVGTREPRKNLGRAIEAFNSLNLKDYQIVIAGKYGWGDQQLKVKSEKLKVLGFVPIEDLVALYSSAAALVYPSLYEGFGLPILDAMSCGCPVITSNIGATKEVGGGAAILIDPLNVADIADAMRTIADNADIGANLSIKGIEHAKQFSWEKAAEQTLNIYREAVENR